jgi:hypothetical protein
VFVGGQSIAVFDKNGTPLTPVRPDARNYRHAQRQRVGRRPLEEPTPLLPKGNRTDAITPAINSRKSRARWIAANFAKLPELFRKEWRDKQLPRQGVGTQLNEGRGAHRSCRRAKSSDVIAAASVRLWHGVRGEARRAFAAAIALRLTSRIQIPR